MNNKRAGRVRALIPAGLAFAAILSLPGSAVAADPASFACAADAVTVQLGNAPIVNPITTGRRGQPCQLGESGLPKLAEAVSLGGILKARTAYAITDPAGVRPFRSNPYAKAGIEDLQVTLGGPVLGVGAARSSITASCVDGAPNFVTASEVANISLAGQPIVLDGVLQPITDALTDAVGALVEVRLNEVVDLPDGGKAVRAARVTLIRGNAPLAEVIIAGSQLDLNGRACDPEDGGEPVDPGAPVCPAGSFLDVTRKLCVIRESNTVVGPPGKGPTGGTVIDLDDARKRFKSSCLNGPGPRYAVIGTKRSDRITGTNRRDRILSLGGKDRVDGGRKNDCVDGGKGKDRVGGGQGQDRTYGGGGRDVVSGDGGSDRLFGNKGNDFVNAGYSQGGMAKGGAGRDRINVATSGRATTVRGGKQFDIVWCNKHELKLLRGIEKTKIVIGPKQKRD